MKNTGNPERMTRRPWSALAALPLALGTALPVQAADMLLGDDDNLPVVLSATRLRQSIPDAPASITIIDRQMISQSGARELPEILRLVPGMVSAYDSGWEAFVSYHGTSADLARRMQVLIDGRSIYQPDLAYVDWLGQAVELDDIDRIEVIRGPNAAAYGANSFMGVVNIITRHPADLPTLRTRVRTGADGIADSFVSAAGTRGQASWQVSADSRQDHGFAQQLNKDGSIRGDYADDKQQRAVRSKLVLDMAERGQLTLDAGFSHLRGQNPTEGDGGLVAFLENPVTNLDKTYLSLQFERAFNSHTLQLQSDYSEFRQEKEFRVLTYPGLMLPELRQMFLKDRIYLSNKFMPFIAKVASGSIPFSKVASEFAKSAASTDPAMNVLASQFFTKLAMDGKLAKPMMYLSDENNHESRLEAELQDTWQISPTLRMVMGSGIQTSRSNSPFYFGGKVENSVWRLFAHGEWQFLPDWRLNAGLMDEHDDSAGHFVSPRLALNWRFAPTQSLRLVSSRAYRTPDLLEEKANWQFHAITEDRSLSRYDGYHYYLAKALDGYQCIRTPSYNLYNYVVCNDKAPSEEIVSSELGYYGDLPAAHLQLDLRVYQDHLQLAEHNLQVEDFVIAPLEHHQQRGAELSTQWRPHPNWRLLLNYAYDDITGINDNTMFVPLHSGNVTSWYESANGLQASLGYVFYDHLFYNTDIGRTIDLHQLNWRMAKRWQFGKARTLELEGVWQVRLTEDPELRKENGAPRDKVWVGVSYAYD